MGLAGLGTDVQTFSSLMKYKINLYKLQEHNDGPRASVFADLVATSLYEKRFGSYFIQPIVAGLDKQKDGTYEPVIATYDSIGTLEKSYFACGGTAAEFLYGVAEAFYKEDMNETELFECVS